MSSFSLQTDFPSRSFRVAVAQHLFSLSLPQLGALWCDVLSELTESWGSGNGLLTPGKDTAQWQMLISVLLVFCLFV